MKTHYDHLQVSRNASQEVIRAAYQSLVQEWNPDRHANNKEKADRMLKTINTAYEVLSDPKSRAEHDRWIFHQSVAPKPLHAQYANPWDRFFASVIDLFIFFGLVLMFSYLVAFTLAKNASLQQHLVPYINGLFLLLYWLYFSIFESSSLQGTPGKLIFGLRVSDLSGNRIGFGRSTGRHWVKLITELMFFILFVMMFFTERKQGLHDIVAGCLILNREKAKQSKMWIRIVVWCIAAIAVIAATIAIGISGRQ